MLGWFISPREPETNAVKKVYIELAAFLDSVGTENFNEARQKTVSAMKQAEEILSAGLISWQSSDRFKRLYLLNEHANTLFLDVLEIASEEKGKLPPELGNLSGRSQTRLNIKRKTIQKFFSQIRLIKLKSIYSSKFIMRMPS